MILQAPEPVSLRCWTKSGAIMELNNAIPLRYNFYEGDWVFREMTECHFDPTKGSKFPLATEGAAVQDSCL